MVPWESVGNDSRLWETAAQIVRCRDVSDVREVIGRVQKTWPRDWLKPTAHFVRQLPPVLQTRVLEQVFVTDNDGRVPVPVRLGSLVERVPETPAPQQSHSQDDPERSQEVEEEEDDGLVEIDLAGLYEELVGEQERRSTMRVFLCSPYRGQVKSNEETAMSLCRQIALMGHVPFAPHLLYTRFLDDNDKLERELGIECGLSMMDACNEVWVYVGRGVSDGMRHEIRAAQQKGRPIRLIPKVLKNNENSELVTISQDEIWALDRAMKRWVEQDTSNFQRDFRLRHYLVYLLLRRTDLTLSEITEIDETTDVNWHECTIKTKDRTVLIPRSVMGDLAIEVVQAYQNDPNRWQGALFQANRSNFVRHVREAAIEADLPANLAAVLGTTSGLNHTWILGFPPDLTTEEKEKV